MPVLSPRQSSASALTGSYRSTFSSSSTLDRPYFSSTSYSPRITSYSERYTTRTYSDSDGRRIFSRSGSITEDGITSRFREEGRESSVSRRDSLSRDSGISSIRENSIADFPRRDSSLSRDNPRLSSINVFDSVAELRNKYSPANYVPACLRERNENISRSKSINDIGLPPIETKIKKKVNELNYNNGVLNNSNPTNDNMKTGDEDDNGNRASVADLKKRFDEKPARAQRASLPKELEENPFKISENRFKKQDTKAKKIKTNDLKDLIVEGRSSGRQEVVTCQTSNSDCTVSKLDVNESSAVVKNGVRSQEDDDCGEVRKTTRVNNFASYIPSKDYQKGDCVKNGDEEINGDTDQGDESNTDLIGKRFTRREWTPRRAAMVYGTLKRTDSTKEYAGRRRIDVS